MRHLGDGPFDGMLIFSMLSLLVWLPVPADVSKSKAAVLYLPVILAFIGALATVTAAYLGNKGSLTGVLPGSPTVTITGPAPTVTVTKTVSIDPTLPGSEASGQGQLAWQRDKMHLPLYKGIEIDAEKPAVVGGAADFGTAPSPDRRPAFSLRGGAKGGLVPKASPSLAECQEALVSNATDNHVITRVGHTLCVQSRSGEGLAAATVSTYDPASYEIDVAVKVWQLQ